MEKLGIGGREMTTSGHSKDFVLKVVQPALIGLMDGSVSTLAPVFAVAVASENARLTFLIGLAAAVGAAISMAFSEGLSDDGSLTGRGGPVLRGAITGSATFVGGIMHTLPFLLRTSVWRSTWPSRCGDRIARDLLHPLQVLRDELRCVYRTGRRWGGACLLCRGSDR
jgi:hypothetical protein